MDSQSDSMQQTLDTTQYTAVEIEHYERVFGQDFVSPGGAETARSMIASMGLPAGSHVLDVGCGLGGASFLMGREFGLRVHGIDLSCNMLAETGRRLKSHDLQKQVSLAHGDCLELEEVAVYDAIYSCDVFLHVKDKSSLFKVLYRALRPGGVLLITDYCCGSQPWQPAFADYVAQRGYHLCTVKEYESLVSAAGFVKVAAQDNTEQFQDILQAEIQKISTLAMPEQERQSLLASWHGKLDRATSGDHRWGVVTALKNT